MSGSKSFELYDVAGVLAAGATPSWLTFADIAGNNRSAPGVVNLGNGAYITTPTDTDEAVGCVGVLDCGAGFFPRYIDVAVYKPDNSNQFFSFHVEDGTGALWTGATPTVGKYIDKSGLTRTAPTVVSITTYLFVAIPTAADIAAVCEIRFDVATGSPPQDFSGCTEAINVPYISLSHSPGLAPETLAIQSLREYLLQYLPATLTQINGLRPAVLKTPGIAAVTIPASASLKLSTVSRKATPVTVALTAGSRTLTQVATEITAAAVPGLNAQIDGAGRLTLSSMSTPVSSDSIVSLQEDATGANAALGWDAGGEYALNGALLAPSFRGVSDGHPITAPDMGKGMYVVLGDRATSLWPDPAGALRRDEAETTVMVEVYRPEMTVNPHRNREAIGSCVRAIREVLSTSAGKQLGRASAGDVVFCRISNVKIASRPFSFRDSKSINTFFDVAHLIITVRTFQRPPDAPGGN